MIDQTTLEGKVIIAALDLAASPGWREVSLRDIADAAGCPLGDVMERFESKGAIVRAFMDQVDREMLAGAGDVEREQSSRDALFEVIMSRFDIMAPYKAGLKAIARNVRRELVLPDLGALKATLRTQNRILQAAGIDHEGVAHLVRQLGLASLYNQVFLIWLDDDDPGMARTMAALDRRLRQGERTLGFLDDVAAAGDKMCGQALSFGERLGDILRGRRARGRGETDAAAGPTPDKAENSAGAPPVDGDAPDNGPAAPA